MSMTRKYFPHYHQKNFLSAAITAIFMTVFDFFMEPAAVKLNYWYWINETVPLLNYGAWFFLSLIFSYLANKLAFITKNFPSLPLHAYYAQLIYFFLIYLS
jgi:putative membrane protein